MVQDVILTWIQLTEEQVEESVIVIVAPGATAVKTSLADNTVEVTSVKVPLPLLR